MTQITYDDQYYYKLVTDAKTQETTKTILGIVPILEAVQIDVVTDTVYFLLRTSYHNHTIVRNIPRHHFSRYRIGKVSVTPIVCVAINPAITNTARNTTISMNR